jgi:isoleucyl-tRNA synthetase
MEEEVLAFWEQAKIFKKSVERDAPQGDYIFYDGPPFATGEPHYGHIIGSIMKDVVPRYWTMKGYRVERKWGWDCHGLPIENIVEKELGIKRKTDIEELGVEKFNELCRSKILSYVDVWKKIIPRLGRWADMDNAYKTMDLDYMESIWWVFKELWDKGLIYEGYRSMHVCPRCETTLSQQEVAEGYKDIKDLSAIAKFELENTNAHELNTNLTNGKVFVLAWTTTPWTLIGNVALAVGEDIDYVLIKTKTPEKNSEAFVGLEVDPKCETRSCHPKNIIYHDKNDVNSAEPAEGIEPSSHGMTTPGSRQAAGRNSALNLSYHEYYILAKERLNKIIKNNSCKIIKEFKGKELIGKKYKPLFDYYAEDGNLENQKNGWQIYHGDFVTTEDGTGVVHIAPAFGEDDLNLGKKYDLPFIQHVGMDGVIKAEAKDFTGLNVKPMENTQATDVEIIKYLAHHNLLFSKEKYEHSYPHCWRCDTPLINYATSSWFVNVLKIKDQALELAKDINWSPEHIKEGRFGMWLAGARDWSISRQRYWASVMPIWVCQKLKVDCNNIKVIGSVKELEELSGKKITDLHKHVVDKIIFPCEKCGGEMHRIPDVLDTWFDSGSMPYAQMHYPFENKEKFEKNFPAEFIAEGTDQCRAWFYYLHVLSTSIMKKSAFKNVIVNGIVLAEDGKKMSKRLKNYPDPMIMFDQYGADAMRFYLLSSPVMTAENLNFSEKGVKEALQKNIMILWNVYKFYEMFSPSPACTQEWPGVVDLVIKSKNILDQWILVRLDELISEVTKNMEAYDLPRATRPITDFINDLSTWYIRRSRDRFKSDDEDDKAAALATTRLVLIELAKLMAPSMPFMAENLWQKVTENNFKDENKSVHLESFPLLFQGGARGGRIPEEMQIVRKIVELGLAKRDEAKIKVRQPLRQLIINNENLITGEEYLELIRDEINVKEVKQIKGEGELSVELDTTMTDELKLEGLKRDIVRLINAERKNAGLTISDQAEIYYETENDLIKKCFETFNQDIKKSALLSAVHLGLDNTEGKIKNIKIEEAEIKLVIRKSNP